VRREITRVVLASGAGPLDIHRAGLDQNLALTSREQALSLGAPWTVAQPGGDVRRAVSLYLESLALALARGELTTATQDLVILSTLRSALGELEEAEGCAAWAGRLAARVSESSVLYSNLMYSRACLSFTQGEGLDALVNAGQALRERAAPDHAFVRALLLSFLAAGYALLGRESEARDALSGLLPAVERAPGWTVNYPHLVGNAVAACWFAELPHAGDVMERNVRGKILVPDFRAPHSDARLSLARLCALQSRYDEAADWFAKVRGVLDEQGARPLRAITDCDEALMYVRRADAGDRERAEPLLEQALAQFDAIGMTGWERRARALLSPSG
jgi:tetratricopeptide (TPR) repeat protein